MIRPRLQYSNERGAGVSAKNGTAINLVMVNSLVAALKHTLFSRRHKCEVLPNSTKSETEVSRNGWRLHLDTIQYGRWVLKIGVMPQTHSKHTGLTILS